MSLKIIIECKSDGRHGSIKELVQNAYACLWALIRANNLEVSLFTIQTRGHVWVEDGWLRALEGVEGERR